MRHRPMEHDIDELSSLTSRDKKKLKRATKKVSNVISMNVIAAKQHKLVPKTEKQKELINAIRSSQQVITIGCAGTGKTYVPTAMAADMLLSKKIRKIVLTRPNVPAGPSLGFFPGTMEEKMANWVIPFTSVLKEILGEAQFEYHMKRGNIEIAPLETMRGRTFEDAFVIMDECQNMKFGELKMFLTRIGEGTTVVLNGDVKQVDIKGSGLSSIIAISKRYGMNLPVVEFGINDVVRSDICAEWIKAFDKYEKDYN